MSSCLARAFRAGPGDDLFEPHAEVFHELMGRKVTEILLIATPYDAFIMEEDGSMASKIINEYRGLNLSRPPKLTKVFSAAEALKLLAGKSFDMVITMPGLADMGTEDLVMRIKEGKPELPVVLMSHQASEIGEDANACSLIDNEYVWSGSSDLLFALVKNVEDRLNVAADTEKAMVRVLILVEDSPEYRSFFLPLIYKVVVRQTRAVLEESLNEEHRLLKMRARPKILVAENFEAAIDLFQAFRPYVFAVISDTRFPKNCQDAEDAGIILLSYIKKTIPYLPVLLMSSESHNREKAKEIPARFIDKNSPELHVELEEFFANYLGFGDFVFRNTDLEVIGRAGSLRELEKLLPSIPDEPLLYHARRNHFSNWLMARSEIALASRLNQVRADDFETTEEMRRFIIDCIHTLRRCRQRGVITQFDPREFDPDIVDFVKMGSGSLGGKARGLAFVSNFLHRYSDIHDKYPDINIVVPKTLVIATDGFEAFIEQNDLHYSRFCDCGDEEIRRRFLKADLPPWLHEMLEAFLKQVTGPLSVRSSSLWEDAHVQSYAGMYKTYMIPNNHKDFFVRLHHLVTAIKLVYASTWSSRPLEFSRSMSRQFREDSMAVMIQQIAGAPCGDFFYPAISGVSSSLNYYPVGRMTPEDGIARISLGLGKILEEPDASLRFCPKYPSFMPQFSTVPDILANAQRHFYALRINNCQDPFAIGSDDNLERREIADAEDEFPVRSVCSTYIPDEDRIRDSGFMPGPKVVTFAPMLKHNLFPLADLITDMLDLGRNGIGAPVEIEFSVKLSDEQKRKSTFFFLQLRPLAAGEEHRDIHISREEREAAFCVSRQSLGHGQRDDIADIVWVMPERFEAAETREIAGEIGKANTGLKKEGRSYLLIGPGRWGSADRWLGIPVAWNDISGVAAVMELRDGTLNADASKGSHFFQKMTAKGIHYITLEPESGDRFDGDWLRSLAPLAETRFLRHIRLEKPFLLKNDGQRSQCVLIYR